MSREPKWYSTGFKDALQGLPADPPWQPGHRDYENYRDGYADGERQVERDVADEDRNWRAQ